MILSPPAAEAAAAATECTRVTCHNNECDLLATSLPVLLTVCDVLRATLLLLLISFLGRLRSI